MVIQADWGDDVIIENNQTAAGVGKETNQKVGITFADQKQILPALRKTQNTNIPHQLESTTRPTNDSADRTFDSLSKYHEKKEQIFEGQATESNKILSVATQGLENKKESQFNGPTMHTSRRTELDHNNKIKPFTGGCRDKILFRGTSTASGDKSLINGENNKDKVPISIAGRRDKPFLFRPVGDKALSSSNGTKNPLFSSGVGNTDKPTPFLSLSSGKVVPSLLKGSPFLEKALGVNSSVDTSVGPGLTPSPDYHRTMPPDLADSLTSSLDNIAWNLDGTQTIIDNGSRTSTKSSTPINEEIRDETTLVEELRKLREDNKQLKKSVDEACAVNMAWRKFHEERQSYVQRLLTTIHELQHASNCEHGEEQDGEQHSSEAEVRRLKEDLARIQAEHHEHVTLLEMQVRAHRDDWEAERSDKKAAQTELEETEAKVALLLQELQLVQSKLSESETTHDVCWRCSALRNEDGTNKSRTSSSSSTSNSTHVSPTPIVSSCGHVASSSDNNSNSSVASSVSPPTAVPQTAVTDLPTTPLKGWIPVSMLHHIAFSGSTPEHQSSPMVTQSHQRCQQQQQHPQSTQQRNKESHQKSQRRAQNPQYKHQNSNTTQETVPKSAFTNYSNKPKNLTDVDKPIIDKKKNPLDKMQDKKIYEIMGARPKVIGENKKTPIIGNDFCSSKSIGGVLEDEYEAKHRARSILASAIPISPSSPTTPFVPIKSPLVPNMPKGYMPITSTILTPINFLTPCSSQRCQSVQTTVISPVSSSLSVMNNHNLINSSPVVLETPSEIAKVILENIPPNPVLCTTESTTDQHRNIIVNNYKNQGSTVTTTVSCSNESTYSDSNTSTSSTYKPIRLENETQVTTSNSPNLHEILATSVSNSNLTSITVTTTADSACSNSTTSTYSSATSSRSSSPGFSLTTFALNSEGRGIPGTIFFAMGNDQKGCLSPPSRSPQPNVSPRCTSATYFKSSTPEILTAGQCNSPPNVKSPPISSNVRIKSPTIQMNSVKSPQTITNSVQSPPIIINNSTATNYHSHQNNSSKTKTEEHWWSVEGPNAKATRQKGGAGKLVNSTWVRLMGGQENSKIGSGLPWRTARAVPGHQLEQVRRSSQEEKDELNSNFNYSPAMTLSPSNSVFSSACTSAATSPPIATNLKFKSPEKDLKEMASKNIASAIISYELGAKTDENTTSNTTAYMNTNPPPLPTTNIYNKEKSFSNSHNEYESRERKKGISSSVNYMNDGIETLTCVDLVCPTCQMLFPPDQHLLFLDHFETCRGPTFVDM